MDILIKIIGIVIVITGIVYLIKPAVMKWLIEFFKKGSRIYIAGLLRLTLAVVFLLAATACRITWIITVLGILFLLGGILVLILGPKRTTPFLDWWLKKPNWIMQILAVVTVLFGVLIIFAA